MLTIALVELLDPGVDAAVAHLHEGDGAELSEAVHDLAGQARQGVAGDQADEGGVGGRVIGTTEIMSGIRRRR